MALWGVRQNEGPRCSDGTTEGGEEGRATKSEEAGLISSRFAGADCGVLEWQPKHVAFVPRPREHWKALEQQKDVVQAVR